MSTQQQESTVAGPAGTSVRTLTLQIVEPSTGALQTVQLEVASIVDSDGRAFDFSGDAAPILLRQILAELCQLRALMSQWMGAATVDALEAERQRSP